MAKAEKAAKAAEVLPDVDNEEKRREKSSTKVFAAFAPPSDGFGEPNTDEVEDPFASMPVVGFGSDCSSGASVSGGSSKSNDSRNTRQTDSVGSGHPATNTELLKTRKYTAGHSIFSKPVAVDAGKGDAQVLSSRVLMMTNLVRPGEVDDQLQSEIASECEKFGPVLSCVIFESPSANEQEAVRIFVEFGSSESAVRGLY